MCVHVWMIRSDACLATKPSNYTSIPVTCSTSREPLKTSKIDRIQQSPWRPATLLGNRVRNNVRNWIALRQGRTTVIFNLCDYGQKLADFSLFCSTPTKKSCKIARNCHFALHHHAIDFPFLNRKY